MTLLGFILQFINAKVSIAKINDLKSALKEEDISDEVEEVGNWNSIRYQSVGFKYKSRSMLEEVTFEVGPIDFEIFKGEVTFITGGNGSGKSTLGKLISLHYLADYGSIYFGETKVKRGNFKSFRQNVCAIFSDYHLFDRLLASDCKEKTVAKVNEYLSMLKLEEKVTFNGGQFSSVSALSSGQKRRLSLLVALIEDKDLYLFDEWAADQDPQFRNIFYTEILQRLKQEGKAVIVITHDDRYFSLADNLIVMENGVIRSGNRKQADGKKTLKGASALVSSI
jgi:putative ATP-binding cassette transporter